MPFPTNLDTHDDFLENETLDASDHAAKHNAVFDEIEVIEAKIGVDSSAVTSSHDYKLSGVAGSDKAVSRTGTETLTNKTLTSPKVNTINEETPANGVTVDGLNIRDGKLNTNDSVVTDNITANAVSQSAVSDVSDASNNSYNNSLNHAPTAGTFKDVSGLSVNLTTTGGDVVVSFSFVCALSVQRNVSARLVVDSDNLVKQNRDVTTVGNFLGFTWVAKGLSAGAHTFKIQATNDGVDATFTIYDRFISAFELKR